MVAIGDESAILFCVQKHFDWTSVMGDGCMRRKNDWVLKIAARQFINHFDWRRVSNFFCFSVEIESFSVSCIFQLYQNHVIKSLWILIGNESAILFCAHTGWQDDPTQNSTFNAPRAHLGLQDDPTQNSTQINLICFFFQNLLLDSSCFFWWHWKCAALHWKGAERTG